MTNKIDKTVDWLAAQRFWLLMLLALASFMLIVPASDAAWKPFDITFLIGCVLAALWTMPEYGDK